MRICIYQDYMQNNGAMHKVLCNRYGKLSIDFIDAADIKNGALNKTVSVFIMGGGESRYAADKLNGAGNAAIRKYVEEGGSYLGICAGAYYASAKAIWRQERCDVSLEADNELALFKGTARGPISELECYISKREIPSQVTRVDIDGVPHDVLYWGGSKFEGDMTGVEVVARYTDIPEKPAAIIKGTVGKGRYILSSPHIEFDPEIFDLIKYNVPRNAREDLNSIDGRQLTSYFLYECIKLLT